jgi:hypothetical protein
MRVSIGLVDSTRELEVQVEDVEEFMKEVERAVGGERPMVWADDLDGHTYGIAAEKIAYIHLEAERERIVGFG